MESFDWVSVLWILFWRGATWLHAGFTTYLTYIFRSMTPRWTQNQIDYSGVHLILITYNQKHTKIRRILWIASINAIDCVDLISARIQALLVSFLPTTRLHQPNPANHQSLMDSSESNFFVSRLCILRSKMLRISGHSHPKDTVLWWLCSREVNYEVDKLFRDSYWAHKKTLNSSAIGGCGAILFLGIS